MNDAMTVAISPTLPHLSDTNRYVFDTCGYCVLRGFLDAAGVSACLRVLDALWMDRPAKHGLKRINGLADMSPELRKLAEDVAYRSGVYDVINQPFRLIESYAHHRIKGSAQALHNGLSNPNRSTFGVSSRTLWREHLYHDGKLYCMMVKALVYLTDITSTEDAPFCLVNGSHKANFRFPGDISDPALPTRLPPEQVTVLFPRAGDVLLLNEALLHGSYPKVSESPRVFAAFSYSPSFVSDYHALNGAEPTIWARGHCE